MSGDWQRAGVAAYPLSWPEGWPRTPVYRRTPSRFSKAGRDLTVADARTRLADELDRLGARNTILSTHIVLRADGLPRSGQSEPSDPGAAIYFTVKGTPTVMACDRYTRVADNIAALAATIEAKRAAIRHGVVTVEQEFRGYAALPPPVAPDDWRAALGNPTTLAEAESAYRERMRAAHPDAGGSHARAAALNAAIAKAREVLR